MPAPTAPATASPGTGSTGTKPSCIGCPANLSVQDQNTALGSNIKGPMCGVKLLPIGRPGQTTGKPPEELWAENCESHGKRFEASSEARQAAITLQVALPTPTGTPRNQGAVASCYSCAHYVPPGIMLGATGWSAGLCRAKGTLLMPDRLHKYADGCDDRSYTSSPLPSFDPDISRNLGLVLLPEYQDGYGTRKLNPADLLKRRPIEADKYETDFPVTPGAARLGVRAWRKIVDPEGFGPDLKLPVFAKEFFTDEVERAKIPKTGDQEHPEGYIDYAGLTYKVTALLMELDETPAIWGPPGVGKTEFFRYLAWLMGAPFERISITATSDVDDLFGKMAYSSATGTHFILGRIPRAWEKTNVLCLDEPNAGPPEVWQAIRPLTDNSKQLVLDMYDGRRFERNYGCYFGMAMNPPWDIRNSGISTLADADGSRLAHLFLDLPPEDIERAIIMQALMRDGWEEGAAKKAVDLVMLCASDLRQLAADDVIPVSWGVRTQLKVARAMKFFSPLQAYRVGIADALDPSGPQTVLLDAVKSRIPE